jgi:hypothetical protein
MPSILFAANLREIDRKNLGIALPARRERRDEAFHCHCASQIEPRLISNLISCACAGTSANVEITAIIEMHTANRKMISIFNNRTFAAPTVFRL